MSFKPLRTVTSRTMVLPLENIDTDQIMPAKFLSMTTKAGLGEHVFANLRYNEDGSETEHELNRAKPVKYWSQVIISDVDPRANMRLGA